MLLDSLKAGTRLSHQALEKLLIQRLKNISDTGDYALLLSHFYGYLHPLEQTIKLHLNEKVIPDLHERRKTEQILHDIQSIGAELENVYCNDLPTIQHEADALAAMYVMEGSTLGGSIIAKMLHDRLGVTPEKGVCFFYGYGEDSEKRWKSFTDILQSYTPYEKLAARMVHTADQTFRKFQNWLLLHSCN